MGHEIDKIFSELVLDLSGIITSYNKIADDMSQDNVDSITEAIEGFEENYVRLKQEISNLLLSALDKQKEEDDQKIDVTETEKGFEL